MLTLTALIAAVQGPAPSPARALSLSQVDGGSQYYGRFSHGLPTRKSYFPIGVWFESVTSQADVNKDRDAGLNLYVVLTANSDLSLVQSNGMRTLLQHEDWGSSASARANPAVAGWVVADEIDMLQSNEEGAIAARQELNRILAGLPQDGRARYSNYAKGVLFWNSDSDAAQYVNNFQQLVSADLYWFTDDNVCSRWEGGEFLGTALDLDPAACRRAANYGATVRRMRGLVNPAGSKPIWAFVELGHPYPEAQWPTITPAQVRAAVWQSLIAGARGIIYFNHSFGGPEQTQHILRDGLDASSSYAPIRSVVSATNGQIRRLAHVLNSPTVRSGWSQGPGTTAMVKWAAGKSGAKKKCKSKRKRCKEPKAKKGAKQGCEAKKKRCRKAKGHLYVFAGSAGSSVNGRFSLPCVGDAKAAVLGEGRTISVRGGSFSDRFANGNAIHIYRIDGGTTCGLPRKR